MKTASENEQQDLDIPELMATQERLLYQLEIKTGLLNHLEKQFHPLDNIELLLGKSEPILYVKKQAQEVAEQFQQHHNTAVLIKGERGVGKGVLARYIHEVALAKDKPFIVLNCAAISGIAFENELFGYESGTYTCTSARKPGLVELANGGTLFIDGIDKMELKMQAKLWQILQTGSIQRNGGIKEIPIDLHVIASTTKDLGQEVVHQKFREDLYHYLSTTVIKMPPLRSRMEDVEILASYFLKELSRKRGVLFHSFSSAALLGMRSYSWPGNARELKAVVEQAMLLETGPVLELSSFRQRQLHAVPSEQTSNVIDFMSLRKQIDEDFVRKTLTQALNNEHGNVTKAARLLKVDRSNLLRMLKRHSIEPQWFRLKKAA